MKKVIIIIAIIMIGCVLISEDTNTQNTTNTNTDSVSKIEITEMSFEEENLELDLKQTKSVVLNIIPQNKNIGELKFNSTNIEIATFEKDLEKSSPNTIYIKIQPIEEGECEVYATYNEIESNKIKVKIIDNERIEREKKEAEEQAKKQTQTTTQKNNSSSQTTSSKQSTSSLSTQSNSNNTHGKLVYRTPSGKRYHFDPDCGGKNSYQTTLDSAKSSGLTPCKKCAQ